MAAIMRICTYMEEPISAVMVAGNVINPPNPVKNPVVVHLVTCIRISCSAACSFFPPQFDKYSCASASTDFEPGMPFNAPSYNFPASSSPFHPLEPLFLPQRLNLWFVLFLFPYIPPLFQSFGKFSSLIINKIIFLVKILRISVPAKILYENQISTFMLFTFEKLSDTLFHDCEVMKWIWITSKSEKSCKAEKGTATETIWSLWTCWYQR